MICSLLFLQCCYHTDKQTKASKNIITNNSFCLLQYKHRSKLENTRSTNFCWRIIQLYWSYRLITVALLQNVHYKLFFFLDRILFSNHAKRTRLVTVLPARCCVVFQLCGMLTRRYRVENLRSGPASGTPLGYDHVQQSGWQMRCTNSLHCQRPRCCHSNPKYLTPNSAGALQSVKAISWASSDYRSLLLHC